MTLSLLGLMRPALCRSLVALVPMVRSPQLVVISRVQLLLPNIFHQNMVPPAASCVRFYATKKSKAKAAKGQASKVNINSSLVEDIISLEEVKEDMAAVLTTLKDDFSRNLSIRTSPGALDHIVVSTADGKFPLNQLGQISMKSPQLIMVNMTAFPEAVGAATRSLRESSMKLNPEVDGTIIRVAIPKVTREHRENLAKLAKQFSNKAKESLRKVRSNAITQVKKAKDTVSEDTIRLVEKQIGQMADSFAADVDKQLTTKTKELLG
ncbi:ribosome-recycling factor, mitochondrial [Salmo salar]|uniref:Ribosome-recycling factor, mitochondrial n=1 Tax=Salmo salar TaxID=8030 RepID=B5XEQ2_SALSA|nr:ribosome-recycling factor, mitochondrial [Salmo salar]ACI69322.1 Ribosome recycling factor, mitochondrial precursor [Salmo salar]|eukprot:XP_013994167.1 PREDICTED: ribosome-recycling factor, mitochondrial [Salmo salar]